MATFFYISTSSYIMLLYNAIALVIFYLLWSNVTCKYEFSYCLICHYIYLLRYLWDIFDIIFHHNYLEFHVLRINSPRLSSIAFIRLTLAWPLGLTSHLCFSRASHLTYPPAAHRKASRSSHIIACSGRWPALGYLPTYQRYGIPTHYALLCVHLLLL